VDSKGTDLGLLNAVGEEPEMSELLIDPAPATFSSYVYAFSMTCMEVYLSGDDPYEESREFLVPIRVSQGAKSDRSDERNDLSVRSVRPRLGHHQSRIKKIVNSTTSYSLISR